MGNYWAEKLAALNGEAPARTVSAPPTPTNTWWAAPAFTPTAPTTNNPVATTPEEPATVEQTLAMVVDPRTTKAQSARNNNSCPDCGSGNYRGGMGANEMQRCFECGYNPRFTQQGSGIPTDASSSATPARQIATPGFNPRNIVGHVG